MTLTHSAPNSPTATRTSTDNEVPEKVVHDCDGQGKIQEGRVNAGSDRDTMRPSAPVKFGRVGDNELGMFLRIRRQGVTPAEAGLPAGPRRRTSGLRRAEVPALTGVSVEYVTRLEQGRDRRPSPQVLSALAEALRLTSERAHLYRLTKCTAGTAFRCKDHADPGRTVRPAVQALLDHPEAGELRLAYETLELPADDDQRPTVHLPADEMTSAALDRLNSHRPRALGVAPA